MNLFKKGKKSFLFILALHIASTIPAFAQTKYTLSGTIKDAKNGEFIIGARIYPQQPNESESRKVTVSNQYGFYSLTLSEGNHLIVVSSLGYQNDTIKVALHSNISMDIEMKDRTKNLKEVVITGSRENRNITESFAGVEKLKMNQIASIPVVFGEKDILKTIQLLPGIKSAGEGSSGFNVRGGSSDQNLILLDEAPVYNASHLMGFFSTFNSDAIKDITVFKGNSPAQYGGRLASVLDVKMNEGNNKSYNIGGGVGLISSRLSIEGPLQKNKSSFIISGRRTYADMFLKLTDNFKSYKLYFYDFNVKANYKLSDRSKIYLSGYFGRDNLGLGEQFGIDWGNKTATLRWNYIINPKLFSNTSLIYSDYSYKILMNGAGSSFHLNSSIKDWNLKQEFQHYVNTNNTWKYGFNSIKHSIAPTKFSGDGIDESATKTTRNALENAAYASNTQSIGSQWNIDYGIRFSSYSMLGKGIYNIYNKDVKTDSVTLQPNEWGKSYFHVELRLSASYILSDRKSIKFSYNRNTQNLHLLSNSTASSPTDTWIGNSYNIQPEVSDQVSVGYFYNFADNAFEINSELYYKNMLHQVDYKNGANIEFTSDVESELLYGKGRAYGLELLVKKKTGRATGWISYTLSRTERKIDGINNNKWYAARQDRTHDISVVGSYQLSPEWTVAATWVYYTGNAVTFPSGKYQIDGKTIFLYTERNGYRMPAYHRMDAGLTYEKKSKRNYQSSWNFGLYNVYGRENAYSISFEDDPENPGRTRAIQTSLFKWIPSITYNFRF